jgi:hypothetical protein
MVVYPLIQYTLLSYFQKVLALERQENRSEYNIQMVTFKLVPDDDISYIIFTIIFNDNK